MSRKPPETRPGARCIVSALPTCIIVLLLACASAASQANEPAGALDLPVTAVGNAVGKQNNGFNAKALQQQVKKEQRELARLTKSIVKQRAEKGERLAQISVGSDLAKEAQSLAFAPAAANDANSDALRWYAVAAKRGYPGAPSLDTTGVSFYPVRVVRNR